MDKRLLRGAILTAFLVPPGIAGIPADDVLVQWGAEAWAIWAEVG